MNAEKLRTPIWSQSTHIEQKIFTLFFITIYKVSMRIFWKFFESDDSLVSLVSFLVHASIICQEETNFCKPTASKSI
jgi:hypothetical protein